MIVGGFDWDEGNCAKCEKHGVSKNEIELLLRGAPRIAPDVAHSGHEARFIAVGLTAAGRAIFVAFTFRASGDQVLVRPITARFMHKKERDAYEPQGAETSDG